MMTRALSIVLVALAVARAAAQPAPICVACARGDALIDQLSLQPVRAIAGELAALPLAEPLTLDQYARVIALRQRTPALVRLGAVDDLDLAAIAAALCGASVGACTDATTHALRCVADRCEVAFPKPAPDRDVLQVPAGCKPSGTPTRSAPLGVGFEWGTGYQRSRYPNDGRAWSFGIEARLRVGRRFGTVARIDRIAGRDAATDDNDDGDDDVWTGSITRISALAGPSVVFDYGRYEGEPRFLRLDLLAGYVSTRSQADESGPAAGFDLSYQLSIVRLGVRFVQGGGDARDATMLLAHLGILAGSQPLPPDDDCSTAPRSRSGSSRLALGFDLPMLGYGLSSELGLLATGLGIELGWYLSPKLDAIVRGDLLLYPGHDRERTIHQAALAGLRIDHGTHGGRRSENTGFFTTVMAGYSHAAGITPRTTGTGPIGELSLGWGIQADAAAAYFQLHGRFGIGSDNLDYRAIFLSGGFQLRLDPRRWRSRG